MKKALSLILVLVLCLSLCACGGNNEPANTETNPQNNESTSDDSGESTTTDSNNENNTTEATSAQIDYKTILMNGGVFWGYTNHLYMTAFYEDGTTVSPDGKWELNGNIVKCTWDDGSTDTYEIKELNGVYYIVGERDTMYSNMQVSLSEIPQKSIEITLDNWQEYFELGSDTYEVLDQFGEPTGETRTSHFLRLKDEYYRYLIESGSEVLVRFSINGNESDRRMDGTYHDNTIQTWYFGFDDVEVGETDVFEMVKIQGTLYFIDGF